MRRVDKLVLQEMFGPWAFGVAIFTVLIMAGSFLFELTRYLSQGVDPFIVLELTGLLLPGVVAKTFPMAVLLSGLLSFGRLSSDSEVVAVKAAGVSVGRVMAPVAAFGLAVTALTFFVNEMVVPAASQHAVDLEKRIQSQLNGRSAQEMSQGVYQDGKLKTSFWAADFNFSNRTLSRVVITLYGDDEKPTAYLYVRELQYTNEKVWAIRGGGILTPASGGSVETFENAYPSGVPNPSIDASPEELLAKSLSNLDALSMEDMGRQIEKLKKSPETTKLKEQIANLEFGYWNKVAVPLAALVFGLVGAPLGIRSHRVSASVGFWLAVIIIFAYMLLADVMSISAQGGRVPAALASFLPIAIGLVVGGWLIHRRNM